MGSRLASHLARWRFADALGAAIIVVGIAAALVALLAERAAVALSAAGLGLVGVWLLVAPELVRRPR